MATIKDVARDAGVTIGTVSRAFNGYADIKPETKERILQAARDLGYTPNASARSLSSKRPPNIGMIVSGLLEGNSKDNFTFLLLQGVLRYALENELKVALYTTDSAEQRSKSYMQFCTEHSISGAILTGITTDDAYLEELMDSGIPTVAIDVPIEGKLAGWISIDNHAASRDMGRYLLSQGHRDIMIIGGKRNAAVHLERLAGVEEAYAEAGITISPEQVLHCSFDEDRAYAKVYEYVESHGTSAATAFCGFSDVMAFGAVRAITQLGYNVPQDFSVTGFDNLYLTEVMTPPLTTIAQDMRLMGEESARLLHQMTRGEADGGHREVPYELIRRGSVRAIG